MQSKITTAEIMGKVQGLNFVVMGPFLVADMSAQVPSAIAGLPVGEHGMEDVRFGQQTEAHRHKFASFYKSSGLDIECEGERFTLPKCALILVLPGISHSWIPQEDRGEVGSVDWRHVKQTLVAVVA